MNKIKYLLYCIPLLLLVAYNAWSTTGTYTRAVSGGVATASYINNGWDYFRDGDNAILNGDDYTGNNRMLSGTDWWWCSDASCATATAKILGDTGQIIGGIQGTVNNCDLSYTSGTLTINGQGGVALSATSPCTISIKSNTSGATTLAKFTANVTVTDGASSQTDGNLFGITDANWANAMPLFIGVIADPTGTTTGNYLTLSRVPISASGTTGQLCQLTSTDCDDQSDVMILTTASLTLANWASKPITQIGWIQGTYATSGGAWTFSLNASSGFNTEYEKIKWTMPLSQMGASTGTFFVPNSGTAPVFTTNVYYYKIDSDANVYGYFRILSDAGTDGVGAVSSGLTIPYASSFGAAYYGSGTASVKSVGGAAATQIVLIGFGASPQTYVWFSEGGGTLMQNGDFSNGDRQVYGSYYYTIF